MEKLADNTNNRLAAYKVLSVIMVFTMVTGCVLLLGFGRVAAYSAVLGGVACLLPNFLFTRFAFRYSATRSAVSMLRWFYVGEAIKITVTALIFALIVSCVDELNFAAMFITYIVALMMNIHGLALVTSRHNDRT